MGEIIGIVEGEEEVGEIIGIVEGEEGEEEITGTGGPCTREESYIIM